MQLKKLTLEEFIVKASFIHKNIFDYSLVKYKNNKTKVKIICPEHGVFEQMPSNHLSGSGCYKCIGRWLTIKEFIKKCNIIHNDKYDYSLVNETTSYSKIKIICPKHDIFVQTTNCHLNGHGCNQCFLQNRIPTNENFILKAIKKHNNTYDYSKVNYEHSKKNVKIICSIHGEFEQTPNTHLKGNGCPKCGFITASRKNIVNSHSFSLTNWKDIVSKNKNAKPKLYIIKCFNEDENFIKIGITINTVKIRYYGKKNMPYKYEILDEFNGSPELIFKTEKSVHKNFKNIKYSPNIKFNGATECYDIKHQKELINYCESLIINHNS